MSIKNIKAVLYDMDGVLIDSMPTHVASWQAIYNRYSIDVPDERIYMDEGRVGISNIENIFEEKRNITLSRDESKHIYLEKTEEVKKLPTPLPIPNMYEFVTLTRNSGCATSVVTGSGQMTLINRLDQYYPSCFDHKKMVSALDVEQGKPDPEPFLKGLQKHSIDAHEAIVIENAPLGVQSAKAAGIFVLAINTGKLENKVLEDYGADVVVNSAAQLIQWWKENINA